MGCDIHVVLEIRAGAPKPYHSKSNTWFAFASDIFFQRNYQLFALMANVRNEDGGIVPVSLAKGFPKDAAWETKDSFLSHVVLAESISGYKHTCNKENARNWVEKGLSVWFEEGKSLHYPSWHTPSWMTVDELLVIEERLTNEFENVSSELSACIRAMEVFDPEHKGYARLVFWFDS